MSMFALIDRVSANLIEEFPSVHAALEFARNEAFDGGSVDDWVLTEFAGPAEVTALAVGPEILAAAHFLLGPSPALVELRGTAGVPRWRPATTTSNVVRMLGSSAAAGTASPELQPA